MPVGPVRTVEEVLDDQWFRDQGTIVEVDHPAAGRLRTMGSPFHLSATPAPAVGLAPRPGEYAREVLGEFGFTGAELDLLAAQGAIPGRQLCASPSARRAVRLGALEP